MTSKAFGLAQLGNAYSDGALSSRNLIINGAMQVAQRGTSFTGSAYTLDRWLWVSNAADATITQDSLAPSPFTKSLKVDVTATKSPSSVTYAAIIQRPEAFNFDQTGWGTSDGKPVTMSFYTYTNKTGTYSLTFKATNGGFDVYVATYTVTATDTWERHEITIPAPSTWNTRGLGASAGAEIGWWLSGQNTETATPNQWLTVNANMATTQVNLFDNTANYFYLTGVQLEVGSVATPFEHRSYGQELALCQRYYFDNKGPSGAYTSWGSSGGYGALSYPFKVSMRADPTIVVSALSAGSLLQSPSANTESVHFFTQGLTGGSASGVTFTASAEL